MVTENWNQGNTKLHNAATMNIFILQAQSTGYLNETEIALLKSWRKPSTWVVLKNIWT
jgi:hypothetical protein